MNYHPKGMKMWDAWYCKKGDEIHVFHLQRLCPGSKRTMVEADSIGHAVSRNLITWEELPNALTPGQTGSLDDMCLFTGCTYEWKGRYYMYYTMRSSVNNGYQQLIGLATSEDLHQWKKYENNPVIVPDSCWYCSPEKPGANGLVDCRDFIVTKAPDKEGFYGFYAARMPSEEMPAGATIACVYSKDLYNWRHLPPAFTPGHYSIVEVPEVFYMDGHWYMLCLCNNEYGNRNLFCEKDAIMGTIYAVADNIEGPYHEVGDNLLLASMQYNGISCRTVEIEGKRYVLYTSTERDPQMDSGAVSMGVLSTPKELRIVDGKLRACYSDLIEIKFREVLLDESRLEDIIECHLTYATKGRWKCLGGSITGDVNSAWTRYTFKASGQSFIYSASIIIEQGVGAGLAFKQSADGYNGIILMLDCSCQKLQLLSIPRMIVFESRDFNFEFNRIYNVKVISKDKFIECYVDDVLYIQCVCYFAREGYLGLVIDRGLADFKNIKAIRLECDIE